MIRPGVDDLEINLKEVIVAQPAQAIMPIHNDQWTSRLCLDMDNPENYLKIFISLDAYQGLLEYAQQTTNRELGGVLMGDYCIENKAKFVTITDFIQANSTSSDEKHIEFNHQVWEIIERERSSKRLNNKQMVGWFHTHPGWGIFLSDLDMFIQQKFFNLPWQVALVIDPCHHKQGFFVWEQGKISRSKDYYLFTTKKQEANLKAFFSLLQRGQRYEPKK